jgi:hypothetical protein
MSYGYGLGVYWEDYNDPEEPDNDWCNTCQTTLDGCICPEVSVINVTCPKCQRKHEVLNEGQSTDAVCYNCKPKVDLDFEPPF